MTLTLTQAAWIAMTAGVLVGMLLGAWLTAKIRDQDLALARMRLQMTAGFILGVADSGHVDQRVARLLRSEAHDAFAAAGDTTTVDGIEAAARGWHPSS